MRAAPSPKNRILAQLSPCDLERVCRRAEPVRLPLGEVVCDPGRPLSHVYFPCEGILSSVVILESGDTVEAAMIGNEGMAGVAVLVDSTASPQRVVQQMRGEVLRVPAADFRAVLAESAAVHELTERYAMALMHQCGQNVACNAHHGAGERMCRWLLASSDRVGSSEFDITQEYLAQMLGVRRQTIGITAQQLQYAGLLSYRRGRIVLHDRDALERKACECYRVTKQIYDRVVRLPQVVGANGVFC